MGAAAERKYPLKQPPNYKAPVTRWKLDIPHNIDRLFTLYVGVQSHNAESSVMSRAEQAVQQWIDDSTFEPAAVDTFRVTEGFDVVHTRVWVLYWTDEHKYSQKVAQDLRAIWASLGEAKQSIGLWTERFETWVERFETNYARTDHKPGVAQIPSFGLEEHNLSAYWGAGRDRIPQSGQDLFETPEKSLEPDSVPKGLGERLTGTNYDNMCHIRSGQWWVECDDEERRAYEDDLQEKLMTGMRYLWDHPQETGTIGLRFLQNVDDSGNLIKETCGAGFFRNWADLEKWSSRHPSHLAIFNGAQKHAKKFGEQRKFMTWHEVSILKAGEAKFEYINCDPNTGVIGRVPLDKESLISRNEQV